VLVVRPESVAVVNQAAAVLSGQIADVVFAGAEVRLTCTLPSGTSIILRQGRQAGCPAIGDRVHLGWLPESARFIPSLS
jgi:ABC-type Fe3+/spermidine/putrescine transport system ATPase subunit